MKFGALIGILPSEARPESEQARPARLLDPRAAAERRGVVEVTAKRPVAPHCVASHLLLCESCPFGQALVEWGLEREVDLKRDESVSREPGSPFDSGGSGKLIQMSRYIV